MNLPPLGGYVLGIPMLVPGGGIVDEPWTGEEKPPNGVFSAWDLGISGRCSCDEVFVRSQSADFEGRLLAALGVESGAYERREVKAMVDWVEVSDLVRYIKIYTGRDLLRVRFHSGGGKTEAVFLNWDQIGIDPELEWDDNMVREAFQVVSSDDGKEYVPLRRFSESSSVGGVFARRFEAS